MENSALNPRSTRERGWFHAFLSSLGWLPVILAFQMACHHDSPLAPHDVIPRARPAAISKSGGDGQQAAVTTTLPESLRVRVLDVGGLPVGGAQVSWVPATGGGTVSASATGTSSDGYAAVAWTLGTRAGNQNVAASVDQVPSVSFTATANSGLAAAIRLTPDTSSLEVASTSSLQTSSTDRFGNAISGRQVQWASLNPGVASVNELGVVTALHAGLAQVRVQVDTASSIALVRVVQLSGGLAVQIPDDPTLGGVVYMRDGSRIVATTDSSGAQASGAVYTARDFAFPITVAADSAGLPSVLRFARQTVTFSNWTGTTVDIALIDSTGIISLRPAVQLSAAMINRVTSLRANAQRVNQSSSRRSLGADSRVRMSTGAYAGLSYSDFVAGIRQLEERVDQLDMAVCYGGAGSLPPGDVASACEGVALVQLDEIAKNAGILTDEQRATLASAIGVWGESKTCVVSPYGCLHALYDVADLALNDIIITIDNFRNAHVFENIRWLFDKRTRIDAAGAVDGSPDGNAQHGTTGQPLPIPLRVLVYHLPAIDLPFTTPKLEPLVGVFVKFAVVTGGGSITSIGRTNEQGEARGYWTLGATQGTQTVEASVSGVAGSPVPFYATATAPPVVPPSVAISSPTPGLAFTQGASISLSGSATDAANRPITGQSLTWSSNIDGALGHGGTFVVSTLSPGTHTIALTAVDGAGTAGSARQGLTISKKCSPSASLAGETFPNGTTVASATNFTKTWTIQNNADCAWSKGWRIRYLTGPMSTDRLDVVTDRAVDSGQSFVFGVRMSAPGALGNYRDDWQLQDDTGAPVPVSGVATISAQIHAGVAAAAAPKVSEISPASPVASAASQTITVFGSGFQAGLTASATRPDGSTMAVPGPAIQDVSSSSLTISAQLAAAGAWSVVIRNPDGTSSGAFTFPVQGAAAPDLQVLNGAVGPPTVSAGGLLSVSWVLANLGSGLAATSTTVVRINQNATSAAGSNAASVSTIALGAGGSQSQSASLTAPSTLGTYYVWVIADNGSSAGQSSSAMANDIVRLGSFTVAAAAATSDLQVLNGVVAPALVSPGSTVNSSWLLANRGVGAASPSTTAVRVNQSSTSSSGANVTTIAAPALAVGASQAQSATLTASTTAGTYYVWVIADITSSAGQSTATSTNDIAFVGSFTVTAAAMSGTLTLSPTGCTIPSGASTCAVSVSWTTVNPVSTSTVTTNYPVANTTVATGNSGGPLSVALGNGTWGFYLYHSEQLLNNKSVTASCAAGTTWNGSSCQATTTIPAAPTNLSALGAAAVVSVVWTDNSSNEDGFSVERSSAGSGFVPITTVTGHSYLDYAVSAGVTYTYRVRAYNSAGSSAYTNTATGTPTALVMSGTLTLSPTACTIASGASTCNISMSWTTTNPVATSRVTSEYPVANYIAGSGNSGTATVPVPHAGRNFYLYNNNVLLQTRSATASCVSGTTWNGSMCR